MKKSSVAIFVVIALLFAVLMGGIYWGRNMAKQPPTQTHTTSPASSAIGQQDTAARVNINTATKEELMTLPGIGEELAQRIINYRQTHGDFQSVADLSFVEGLGQKRIEAILDLVTVGG